MQRRFKPVEWSYNGSIYEVNIRQYTPEGTFNAFAAHLPRLKDMGIQILWFMPITPISEEIRQGSLGSYYACSDYTTINPEFGTLADFTSLVKKAHEMGFKVIIDWVANHTGWDHVWTKTHPEYYKKDETGKFYDSNNWHDVIDLNFYDQGLRAAMTAAMQYWVTTCDIDGFRCDMAHLVPLDFWRQARTMLDAVKPLFWLAETEQYQYLDVFDSWYAWHWMSFTAMFCKQEKSLFHLQEVLQRYKKEFPIEAFPLFFTTNHDENSWNGTEYEKYGDAAKALAVFSCTYDGLALVYSGQELPNRKRLKFFDKDPIEWTATMELHDFYKTLLQLRQRNPTLMAGTHAIPQLIYTNENNHVLSFLRRNGNNDVFVALNLSALPLTIQLPDGNIKGSYTDVFSGKKVDITTPYSFELEGWGYLILEK